VKIQHPARLNGMTTGDRAKVEVMGRLLSNKYDCIRVFRCLRCDEDIESFGHIGEYEKPVCGECSSRDDVQFMRLKKT